LGLQITTTVNEEVRLWVTAHRGMRREEEFTTRIDRGAGSGSGFDQVEKKVGNGEREREGTRRARGSWRRGAGEPRRYAGRPRVLSPDEQAGDGSIFYG